MAEYNPSKIIKDGNTYNFRDTTKIPLAGSNAISGSLIPATTNAYDLGGSSYQWNNAYIKSLTINGVACGDILTHNVNEFVDVTRAQTIDGVKEFTDLQTIRYGTRYKGNKNAYILPEFSAGHSGLSITTLGFSQTLKIGNFALDNNNKPVLDTSKAYIQVATGENNNVNACLIEPRNSASSSLGTSTNKWKDVQTEKINGLTAGDILTHNASEFVPVTGTSALAGSIVPSTDNAYDLGDSTYGFKDIYTNKLYLKGSTISKLVDNSYLLIGSASVQANGAAIRLNGKDLTTDAGYAFIMANDGTQSNGFQIRPNGDTLLTNCLVLYSNKDNSTDVGAPAYRYKVIYATTGTINTSDARFKNSVKDIDDALLDAWGNIEPKQYKFNDATEKKGEKARYHTGYLAQDIQAECEKHGVNASDYGLFCYDEWEEQEEVSEEIETEKDGKIVKEKRIIQPKREKGNMYALRYEEALIVECAYLRKKLKELTARIEQLEKGNNIK